MGAKREGQEGHCEGWRGLGEVDGRDSCYAIEEVGQW